MKRKIELGGEDKKDNVGGVVVEEEEMLTPTPSSNLSKKRKPNHDETLHDKYIKKVGKLNPTFPHNEIRQLVNEKFPVAMASILDLFGISLDYSYLIPTEQIKRHIINIIKEAINIPMYKLVYTYLSHFQHMKTVIETYKNDEETSKKLAEVLVNMEPPGKGEDSFADYVNELNFIIKGVIKRVAGVIESKELMKGNGKMANVILSQINLDYNIKVDICIFLTNFICVFGGEDFYTYFMDNEKFVQNIVSKYITKD
uniref:Wsv310-like protein n=1 Tax=Pasiphaea japonica whispovirus TaxID=2984286 RepID=A0A9C7C9T0_9VIRU|nr:MAG: wsv310-like protein [Pasiphaea japonica whispovirus]